MIDIKAKVVDDDVEFTISGHGPSDICAGISAIKSTAENYVSLLSEAGVIEAMHIEDDGTTAWISLRTGRIPAVDAFVDALFLMFSQFASQYPESVTFIFLS